MGDTLKLGLEETLQFAADGVVLVQPGPPAQSGIVFEDLRGCGIVCQGWGGWGMGDG